MVIAFIGYLAGLIGFLAGGLLTFITNKEGKRAEEILMGFTGGLLIAFICFELLPGVFENGGYYIGIFGILLGVFTMILIEYTLPEFNISNNFSADTNQHFNKYKLIKAGTILALGVGLHKIPEGIALGSLLSSGLNSGLRLSAILIIHCIPEGLSVSITLKGGGMSYRKIIVAMILMAIPMGIGSFIGYKTGDISPFIIDLSLSFSGGIMLYVTCGEILPEPKKILDDVSLKISSLIGFILGIVSIAAI